MADVLLLHHRRALESVRSFAEQCFTAGLDTHVLTPAQGWFSPEGPWSPGPNVHNLSDLQEQQRWPHLKRSAVRRAKRWKRTPGSGYSAGVKRRAGRVALNLTEHTDRYLRPQVFAGAAADWADRDCSVTFEWLIAMDDGSAAALQLLKRRFPAAQYLLVRHDVLYPRVLARLTAP